MKCVNCKMELPPEYAETSGKFLNGEVVRNTYFCKQKDYRERCFKINGWKTPRSYRKINEAIKKLSLTNPHYQSKLGE